MSVVVGVAGAVLALMLAALARLASVLRPVTFAMAINSVKRRFPEATLAEVSLALRPSLCEGQVDGCASCPLAGSRLDGLASR